MAVPATCSVSPCTPTGQPRGTSVTSKPARTQTTSTWKTRGMKPARQARFAASSPSAQRPGASSTSNRPARFQPARSSQTLGGATGGSLEPLARLHSARASRAPNASPSGRLKPPNQGADERVSMKPAGKPELPLRASVRPCTGTRGGAVRPCAGAPALPCGARACFRKLSSTNTTHCK